MNNPAKQIEQLMEFLQMGLLDQKTVFKMIDDIELCWLVGNELLYFAAKRTVKILELE